MSFEQLLQEFRRAPHRFFSEAELVILSKAAGESILAAKILALHRFKAGAFDEAIALTRNIVDRERSVENVKNLAVALRDAGKPLDAVEVLQKHRTALPEIQFHDLMCSCLHRAGKRHDAKPHGELSLALKDQSVKRAPAGPLTIRPYDVAARGRNVIAYSVFGTNRRYLAGAMNNAIAANFVYPGWCARFYVDKSVPEQFRAALRKRGAEVVIAPDDLPAARFGLVWRFLIEDDPGVDLYVLRDADSVITVKERSAVAEWLESGKAFHIMRDNMQHTDLVLAGMWGAHRGNLGPMRERLLAYIKDRVAIANDHNVDQAFLRDEIWPIMRHSVTIHDSVFDFMSPCRYDPKFALPPHRHVGQNDWIFQSPPASSKRAT